MQTIHRFMCDLLNLFYTKPEGEEYTWTYTQLFFAYGFLALMCVVAWVAS